GHLGLVARHLGCELVGLEADTLPKFTSTPRHLNDDLCQLFRVERVRHTIRPFEPIVVPGRFDLVMCLMGTFARYQPRIPGRRVNCKHPWTWSQWAYLLDQMIEDVMEPDRFLMYFQVAGLAPVAAQLAPFCASKNVPRGEFTIDHTVDRKALRRLAKRRMFR